MKQSLIRLKETQTLAQTMNLVSIDFETANTSRVSICAAGMAVFVNGILTESPYWLVKPPKGHGWFQEDFIECHHLTYLDVLDAPEFPGACGRNCQITSSTR